MVTNNNKINFTLFRVNFNNKTTFIYVRRMFTNNKNMNFTRFRVNSNNNTVFIYVRVWLATTTAFIYLK